MCSPAKQRYAISALLEIALQQNNQPIPLKRIAQRLSISKSYLEQIFSELRAHFLVRSIRGPGGGYLINKNLNEVTVAEILKAINTTKQKQQFKINQTTDQTVRSCRAILGHLIDKLTAETYQFLDNVNLENLLEQISHTSTKVNELKT